MTSHPTSAVGKRHRGVRQHPHLDPLSCGDAGDEQVRARADERHRARQGGDVRDRQQHLARRDASRLLELARGGDQHRDERRRVHQRRCHTDRHHQPSQRLARIHCRREQEPADARDHSGLHDPLGQDEHGADGDHPGIREAREQLFDGRQPQDAGQRQACRECQHRWHEARCHRGERPDDNRGSHHHREFSAQAQRPRSGAPSPSRGDRVRDQWRARARRSRPAAPRQMHRARGEDRCGAASRGARRCFGLG